MSITAIGLLNNVSWASYSSRTGSAPANSIADSETARGVTVTISSQGRHALGAEQTTATAGDAEAGMLDQHQLADWDTIYGRAIPLPSLGESASSRDAYIARAFPEWAAASDADRNEFGRLFAAHRADVFKENGIGTTVSYHDALVADKDYSEQIRQQLVERLKQDPRMVELLDKLGAPLIMAQPATPRQ